MDMKKQVMTFVKPAKELTAEDRILTSRGTVSEVTMVEPFDDAGRRPCVEIETSGELGQRRPLSVFLAEEAVLVME